ncbi:MAG: mercury resistance protein [Cellvibrionaceae bacterium]
MNMAEQSKTRSLKGYLLAGMAVVTCPCHIVIAISLLSGTVAGAFLSEHIVIASLLLLAVFMLSTTGAVRLLGQGSTPEVRGSNSQCEARPAVTCNKEI